MKKSQVWFAEMGWKGSEVLERDLGRELGIERLWTLLERWEKKVNLLGSPESAGDDEQSEQTHQ